MVLEIHSNAFYITSFIFRRKFFSVFTSTQFHKHSIASTVLDPLGLPPASSELPGCNEREPVGSSSTS